MKNFKQYYAYCACSSEIVGRAATLGKLINKVKSVDMDFNLRMLGLTKREPYYFYGKRDIHADDDMGSTEIKIEDVQKTAREIGLIS